MTNRTKKQQAKKADKVVDFLKDSIETRIERNSRYGEQKHGGAYIQHGHVMDQIFANGLVLDTPEKINRYGCVSAIVGKIIRVANNFEEGHEDSLRDIPVYAAMLRELYEDGK
jgi:hypothetical protein